MVIFYSYVNVYQRVTRWFRQAGDQMWPTGRGRLNDEGAPPAQITWIRDAISETDGMKSVCQRTVAVSYENSGHIPTLVCA
jgi:hypothetical protein